MTRTLSVTSRTSNGTPGALRSMAWAVLSTSLIATSPAPASDELVEVKDGRREGPPTVDAAAGSASVDSGDAVQVHIDPETGELKGGPPPQSHREAILIKGETKRALSRSFKDLPAFDLLGGGQGVNLRGRFQSLNVVTRNDQGEPEQVCGFIDSHDHDEDHADAAPDIDQEDNAR